jgi:hypothetical protein
MLTSTSALRPILAGRVGKKTSWEQPGALAPINLGIRADIGLRHSDDRSVGRKAFWGGRLSGAFDPSASPEGPKIFEISTIQSKEGYAVNLGSRKCAKNEPETRWRADQAIAFRAEGKIHRCGFDRKFAQIASIGRLH